MPSRQGNALAGRLTLYEVAADHPPEIVFHRGECIPLHQARSVIAVRTTRSALGPISGFHGLGYMETTARSPAFLPHITMRIVCNCILHGPWHQRQVVLSNPWHRAFI
jgi:hypothetical protein